MMGVSGCLLVCVLSGCATVEKRPVSSVAEQIGHVSDSLEQAKVMRAKGDQAKSHHFLQECSKGLSVAFRLAKDLGESMNPAMAPLIEDVANLHIRNGNMNEAEQILKDGLDAYSAKEGKAHPQSVRFIRKLEDIYEVQGNSAKYTAMLNMEKDVITQTMGERNPRTAEVLQRLAEANLNAGRNGDAEKAALSATSILEEQMSTAARDASRSYHELGDIFAVQGKYKEAEDAIKSAIMLAKHDKKMPPNQRIPALLKLAAIQAQSGKVDDAALTYEEAITLAENVFGKNDPNTAAIMKRLSRIKETPDTQKKQ